MAKKEDKPASVHTSLAQELSSLTASTSAAKATKDSIHHC